MVDVVVGDLLYNKALQSERGVMEIRNKHNDKDLVTVTEGDKFDKEGQRLLRLNIGELNASPRHANLCRTEARALAYALLSYAEQNLN